MISVQGGGIVIGDEMVCARESCDNVFIRATHNQKYCTSECCKIETNRKIIEKYHERAAIKRGKPRTCARCGTKLSRYNESNECGSCESTKRQSNYDETVALVKSVQWL